MTELFDWLRSNDTLLWWLGIGSALTFVGTLAAVPFLAARIPADYFADPTPRHEKWEHFSRPMRWLLFVGKNLLGVILVLVGLILIPLPGQGFVTLLIGVLLIDFPGKFHFERWLVTRGPVLKSVNFLRRRTGHEPLIIDHEDADEPAVVVDDEA